MNSQISREACKADAPELIGWAAEALFTQAAADGLVVVDRSWKVRSCSPAAADRLGWTSPPPIGEDLWRAAGSAFPADLHSRFERALAVETEAEALVTGTPQPLRLKLIPNERGMLILLRDEPGAPKLRRDPERLRELNESLRLAHRAARAATWEWRPGEPLRWTDLQAASQLIGAAPMEAVRGVFKDWLELVLTEDRLRVERSLRNVLETDAGRFDFRVRAADGTIRWLETSAIRDASARGDRVVGVTIDVTERKAAEEALRAEVVERRRAERQQRLLLLELNHRVKNTLATVLSIARQTLRRSPDLRPVYDDFEGRLMALSWGHDVLTAERWAGADLKEIVVKTVRPHQSRGRRFILEGPSVSLSPQTSLTLAMALHELSTNAVKHGALSADAGQVRIHWSVEPGEVLHLTWTEHGGPQVEAPKELGFGFRMLSRGLPGELGYPVDLRFESDGLVCSLRAALGPKAPPGDAAPDA